jgi:hypothetical protein
MVDWIKSRATLVECRHVHIDYEQKDRINQAKLMLIVKGTDACTVTASTPLNQSGKPTRKMFTFKLCRCTWMGY